MDKNDIKSKELRFTAFNNFMMQGLEKSNDRSINIEERSQQAVNFFILMLTAITSGLIIVITTVDDGFIKLLILSLGFIVMAGYSAMTYLWLLEFLSYGRREYYLRTIYIKYFQELEPDCFEYYGLSDLLDCHKNAYQKKLFFPVSTRSGFADNDNFIYKREEVLDAIFR